jgi:hypothetical protein
MIISNVRGGLCLAFQILIHGAAGSIFELLICRTGWRLCLAVCLSVSLSLPLYSYICWNNGTKLTTNGPFTSSQFSHEIMRRPDPCEHDTQGGPWEKWSPGGGANKVHGAHPRPFLQHNSLYVRWPLVKTILWWWLLLLLLLLLCCFKLCWDFFVRLYRIWFHLLLVKLG